MMAMSHLAWIPAAAALGLLVSFLFGDLITLPVDLYYLLYFAIIVWFLALYVQRTALDLRAMVSRRLLWGVILGVLGGGLLILGVLGRPETAKLSGGMLWWTLFWRGGVYGTVDGLLLLSFPWVVVWRALGAEQRGPATKVMAGGDWREALNRPLDTGWQAF